MEIKWIKITTDIFDDEKIKLIDSMPDRDALIVIWFKLLTLAGKKNENGMIFLSSKLAYTDEMLATIFNRPLNTVRLALETFEAFDMINIADNKAIGITNWDKHQSVDKMDKIKEQARLRQEKYRAKQKQKQKQIVDSNVTVTLHNAADKIRIDKNRIDKDNNTVSCQSKTIDVTVDKNNQDVIDIIELWNKQDIIKHKVEKKGLKALVKKKIKAYGKETLKQCIKRYAEAYESDYSYCSYKWGLDKFLKQTNCLEDFMDDGTKWINYLDWRDGYKKDSNGDKIRKECESIGIDLDRFTL